MGEKMLMVFLLLLSLGAAWTEEEIIQSFVKFLSEHRPEGYNSHSEFELRFSTFRENYIFIEETNASQSDFTLALNEYADMTVEEFKSVKTPLTQEPINLSSKVDVGNRNWTDVGVTGVVDARELEESAPVVVAKSIETLHFLTTGDLVELSWQQLVDCVGVWPTFETYLNYAAWAGGLMSAYDYPNNGEQGDCKYDRTKRTAVVNDYEALPKLDQSTLASAAYGQTVVASVDSSNSVWMFYRSGVISTNCGKEIDHPVLIVGVGTDTDGGEYWIIQNTWGSKWGENGYARLLRNGNTRSYGECGIAVSPYIPKKR